MNNSDSALDLRARAAEIVIEGMFRDSVLLEGVAEEKLRGLSPEACLYVAIGMRISTNHLRHPDTDPAEHALNCQWLDEIAAVAADRWLVETAAV